MKQRTGYILALTLVATTLCAGRWFVSDAQTRSQPATHRLVARLTKSLGRTVARRPLIVERQLAVPSSQPVVVLITHRSYCLSLSPLQLHLPPPLL